MRMIISDRPFTDDDLPHLQNALARWIHEVGDLGYLHIGDIPHRIYNTIRGRLPHGELVRVWEESGEIIGMMIGGPHCDMFDVLVCPDYRGTQLEIDMLQVGYEITRRYMNEIGHTDKAVVMDVHKKDVRRIQSLLAVGFEAGEPTINVTERSLATPIPEPMIADGFSIRSVTLDDYPKLAAVHSGAFGSNWTPPELYRDEVMLKPGYLPENEVVVVTPEGHFAAFTKTWLDEVNQVGYFEPVGVHRDYHRKGLGRAMMVYCLHEMKRLGMQKAQVDHEVSNPASKGLYNSLGFRTKHEVIGYQKP